MDPILAVGLATIFLALTIVVLTVASVATPDRSGVTQALADIERVYAPTPHPPSSSLTDRALRPVFRALASPVRRLTPTSAKAWIQRWLDLAGNPPRWSPERVFELQGLGFLLLGFVGGLVGLGIAAAFDRGVILSTMFCGIAGALIGLGLPYFMVLDMGQRRQQQIAAALPDALDMLTLSVEAGLGFDQALAHVATGTRGPLAREIARSQHEMQMGKDRAEAMRALADRTTVPELRTVAIAIMQASQLGVPMSAVLREQASEMRVRRRQRAEEKARKVPVKVLFPLMFCLLPALFVVILGPAVLRIIDAFR
jgi:tight adherence protein C